MNSIALRLALFMIAGWSVTVHGQSHDAEQRQPDDSYLLDDWQTLSLTAKVFRQAVQRIQPCLVTIESFGGVSAIQGQIGGIRRQGEGNTTGVMISPDGYVVTSTFNFIQRPPIITVITGDGQRRIAQLLGRDETRKICLLKIEGVVDHPIPEFVDPQSVRVGQWAISLGIGYGDTLPAISSGIISAKNRIGGRAIQTDANISPASYGGPLIDLEGRLLGICVPLNPQSQALGAGVEWYDSGIGFAVPLHGLDRLLERLKQGEIIRPAFLGIQSLPHPDGRGLLIEQVVPDSAAADAGVMQGDRLIRFQGVEINDVTMLRSMLNRLEAGEEVRIAVERGEPADEHELTAVLGVAQADNEQTPLEPPKIR
ncbi:MAG TPA: trypsin-like peptidase domain-containing protein [Pirellulaceae bacterium]|nr:trypsin-like peptidase domain-containing protein [Pirellulaceae bacterium]